MPKIFDKNFKTLISKEEIGKRIEEIAKAISLDYNNSTPLFLSILNGSYIFAADLSRALDIEMEISFLKVASYEGTNSTGKIKTLIGINESIEGRDIIILDDIIDTGFTMDSIIENLSLLKPNSIRVCSLLFKSSAFKGSFQIDYFGFDIDDKFVIGYGLDYRGKGRNLQDIYVLSE